MSATTTAGRVSNDTSLQQYWLTITELCVHLCAADDGRSNRPKHVETFRNTYLFRGAESFLRHKLACS